MQLKNASAMVMVMMTATVWAAGCLSDNGTTGGTTDAADVAAETVSDGGADAADVTADVNISSCPDQSTNTLLVSGLNKWGECLGDCRFEITFDASPLDRPDACDVVKWSVCPYIGDCTDNRTGTLTAAGHDARRKLAQALVGTSLQAVYGCPDCNDGGASEAIIRRDNVPFETAWEFSNTPAELADVKSYLQQLMLALRDCNSTDMVVVDPGCTPYVQ